jgi:hypothetical protein
MEKFGSGINILDTQHSFQVISDPGPSLKQIIIKYNCTHIGTLKVLLTYFKGIQYVDWLPACDWLCALFWL